MKISNRCTAKLRIISNVEKLLLSTFSRAVGQASRHRPLSRAMGVGYGERCNIDGTCFLVTIVEAGWQAETAIDTEL